MVSADYGRNAMLIAEAVRGALLISPISPKISPGCAISTAPPSRRLISTCPRWIM
jgi:hypothetical protein